MPDNPTKEGYVFAGWFKDREFTQSFAFGDNPKYVTQNFTLPAKIGSSDISWSSSSAAVSSSGDISVTRNKSGDVTEIEGQYVSFDIWNADDALDVVTVLRDELGIKSPDKELKTFLAESNSYGAEYSFRQV